jgi:cytidylate kinase
VFLTADPAQRAVRRAVQDGATAAHAHTTMAKRDHADSTRAVSPLEQAPGAVLIDSTHMDLDEVVAAVLEMVRTHESA